MCNKKQETMDKLSKLIDNIPPYINWEVHITLSYFGSNSIIHSIQHISEEQIAELCNDIKQYVSTMTQPLQRKWWHFWR